MQFLCELYRELVKTLYVYWGKPYATYIKRVSHWNYQIISRMEIWMEGVDNVGYH